MALIAAIFIPFFLVNIYVHEYIHYRQADCSDCFFQRFGWGWKEEAPSGAVAYMDVSGCPEPEDVNEWQPLTFNFAFSLVYMALAVRFLISRGYFLPEHQVADLEH